MAETKKNTDKHVSLLGMIRNTMSRAVAGLIGQPQVYGGERDLNSVYGYSDEPTRENYEWMYKRFGIGTRCVNIFPDELFN